MDRELKNWTMGFNWFQRLALMLTNADIVNKSKNQDQFLSMKRTVVKDRVEIGIP